MEYIDLTWIDSISQLRNFQRIQAEFSTGLDKGKITINKKLLKTLENSFINGLSKTKKDEYNYLEVKTILGYEIYEEKDNWNWNDIHTSTNGDWDNNSLLITQKKLKQQLINDSLDCMYEDNHENDVITLNDFNKFIKKRFGFQNE